MGNRMLWLWRFDGTVGALTYFLTGLALFLVKWSVDSCVSTLFFQRAWSSANYLVQGQIPLGLEARGGSPAFLATMLSISLPFIMAGVALTVRRLRTLSLPFWLVILFFPPVINLLFFVLLIFLRPVGVVSAPPELAEHPLSASADSPWKSAVVSAIITAIVGVPITVFTIYGLGVYGAGLFVGLPFCLGIIAAVLHGYRNLRTCKECLMVAGLAICFLGIALFIGHIEGIVCLLMASPLIMGCALLGAMVGFYIQQQTRSERETALLVVALVLTVPALLGAETVFKEEAPEYAVRTQIVVDRSPSDVWPNVVTFPPLPEPEEWLFRSGIAYPIGATIVGIGAGAERRCEFSTGPFIEPIVVWDEPRLLKFSVTSNPPPLREWSLFGDIHPPHLEGFLVSRAGQFLLDPTSDGRTRLEGTTWYRHELWPSIYWRLWSDAIIHRIHLRVLCHIKQLAERELTEQTQASNSAKTKPSEVRPSTIGPTHE